MPCRGLSENLEDFNECLDQLNEIIQKYMSTHMIFIGGDWNEDIYLEAQSRRKQNMKDFLLENDLVTTQTHKTYIAPTGATVSTLDYIFYQKTFGENVKTLHVLEDLKVNVSDHLPVCCIINFALDKATSNVRGPKVVIALRSSVFFWHRSFPSKSSKLLRGGII